MSEEMKSGMSQAIDSMETERKFLFSSQEVDIQLAHLRPWLEYRKKTAEKWMATPSSYPDIRKSYEELFDHINKQIVILLAL